ncbi:MAG: DUF3795 domain-containing protein [Clostridia bacterium]|nr:DUF3795 domain-containing protein [Clostridia bacterium]
MKDNKYIAFCGLDCEKCEARIATITNDDSLRIKVANLWSKLNNVEITPDMINCVGCKIDGVKTMYCDSLCPIRQCALKNNYNTCGDCKDLNSCSKAAMVISNNQEAYNNLNNKL